MQRTLDLAHLRSGGKRAIAAALGAIEREAGAAAVVALLDEAYGAARGRVIGITGPPGVGKSTLIDGLIRIWRGQGLSVGVIAVDPSSRVSGGALLGDRTRMATDPADQGVFVRSLASRGRLGGLSELAFASVVLMRALFDRVLVESVGVGQSEAEIAAVADTVLLCVQPGSGDSLQFMKAGIMEIPDIAVVTKADMGSPARRAVADLEGALSLTSGERRPVSVLAVSATAGTGMEELAAALDGHWHALTDGGELAARRAAQARAWVEAAIAAETGRRGLALLAGALAAGSMTAPFATLGALSRRIRVELQGS